MKSIEEVEELCHHLEFGTPVEKYLAKRSVNTQNNFLKNSPLHLTVIHNRADLMKILLQNGAMLNKRNKQKDCPRDLAIRNVEINEILDFILETQKLIRLSEEHSEYENVILSLKTYPVEKLKTVLFARGVSGHNLLELAILYGKSEAAKEVVDLMLSFCTEDFFVPDDQQCASAFARFFTEYEKFQSCSLDKLSSDEFLLMARQTISYASEFVQYFGGQNDYISIITSTTRSLDADAFEKNDCLEPPKAAALGAIWMQYLWSSKKMHVNAEAAKNLKDLLRSLILPAASSLMKPVLPLWLLQAAKQNDAVKLAQVLSDPMLMRFADVEKTDTARRLALYYAVIKANTAIVMSLISSYTSSAAIVDLITTSRCPETNELSVHVAARTGEARVLETLLCASGDMTAICRMLDATGRSLAIIAAEHGHVDVLHMLLNCRINIWVRNQAKNENEGETLVHAAVKSGKHNVLLYLLQELERREPQSLIEYVNAARFVDGATPLHIACQQTDTQMCRILMSMGSTYNSHNKAALQPIQFCQNSEVMELLSQAAIMFAMAQYASGRKGIVYWMKAMSIQDRKVFGKTTCYVVKPNEAATRFNLIETISQSDLELGRQLFLLVSEEN